MSYATTDEYTARYGSVTDEDVLQECLDDCTVAIDVELEARDVDTSSLSEAMLDRCMRVCRSMANRIMPADGGDTDLPVGITQMSQTTGPYTRSFTFGTSYGTPRLNRDEKRLLGIGARIGFGALAAEDEDE